jgi:hypothetical protein
MADPGRWAFGSGTIRAGLLELRRAAKCDHWAPEPRGTIGIVCAAVHCPRLAAVI